jgi:SNF2 family DNA or RNA helicase
MDLFEWDPSDRISDRINELYPPDCPPPDGFVEMLDAHYNVNPGPGTWWAIGDKVWRSRKGKEQRSSDTSDTSDRDTDHDRDDNDEEENSSKEDGSDEESMDEDARMLGAAFDLLQRGLQAEDPFISSRHALKATPECFTRVDSAIEFYPHQKSGAGKIDHILHSGQVHPRSALLAWSMGLGKSMVMQAVMHNRRSSSTPTLLVLPLAVLAQWKADLDHSMDPPIDYIVYDKNVGMTTEEMKRHQLVVTTYQMVAADHARKIKTEAAMAASAYSGNVDRYHHHYPLHAMRWESVFADEVGGITNPDAAVTKAMIALQTDKRLGATGTPIPNDYKNLQALMAWLNIEPWTDEEMFNTVRYIHNLIPADRLIFVQYFVKKIAGAHKASPLTGLRNALLAVSLRPYLLRLDWEDTFDGLPVLPKLPKYKERIIPVTLTDPAEIQIQHRARRQWDEVYKTEQEQLEAKEDPDRPSDPCLQLDELLPYLNLCRMALVSPVLADPKYVSRPAKSNRKHHSAAKSLLHEELGIDDEEMMEHRLPKNEALAQIKSDTKHAWHSARMSAFTRDLKKRLETPGKVLVFDESRRVLIVVSNALTEMGIGHYMIHGDVRMSDRTEHLDAFKDPNTGHRVMLMTIRCGGLGLNGLTVANKCYFMTKTNSPFNEAQAMARAVRVGQENNVKVIKFYTHNSIERRTHVIQKEKITKAINTLDPNRVSERKLSQLRRWNTVERFKAKVKHRNLLLFYKPRD